MKPQSFERRRADLFVAKSKSDPGVYIDRVLGFSLPVHGLLGLRAITKHTGEAYEALDAIHMRWWADSDTEGLQRMVERLKGTPYTARITEVIRMMPNDGRDVEAFVTEHLKIETRQAVDVVGHSIAYCLLNVPARDAADAIHESSSGVMRHFADGERPTPEDERDVVRDLHQLALRTHRRENIEKLEAHGQTWATVHLDYEDNYDLALIAGLAKSKPRLSEPCRPFYLAFGQPLPRGRKPYEGFVTP